MARGIGFSIVDLQGIDVRLWLHLPPPTAPFEPRS